MEPISCPAGHLSCEWCGAYPYEECKQPDLRHTPAARKAPEFKVCDYCSSPEWCTENPPPEGVIPNCKQPLRFTEGPDESFPDPPRMHDDMVDAMMQSDTFGGLDETEAKHFDEGKPDLTLIDPHFLRSVAVALGYGSAKYGVDNWRKGSSYRRYMASTLRHIQAFLEQEDVDPESGAHHLAHAACNIMFVMAWQQAGIGKDDRFKPM